MKHDDIEITNFVESILPMIDTLKVIQQQAEMEWKQALMT